jgi:hypothetical protein
VQASGRLYEQQGSESDGTASTFPRGSPAVPESLEADLADAAQEEEGDGAEESVAASAVDKEGEAGACELGIRYPTLQSIYAGKSNKQSIQVYDINLKSYNIISYIMYDI